VIGLDTNVIVRYLAQDEPAQSRCATRIMERDLTATTPGFISVVTLAEVVWVMARCYRAERDVLIRVLETLLGAAQLRVQHAEAVWQAVEDLKQGSANFSDALIARLGLAASCTYTLTFDRKAAAQTGFKLAR
jgi:predicted nucleic-acid-binding protein